MNLIKREQLGALLIGLALGMLIGIPLYAEMLVSWPKRDVMPVVLVKPAIGGFVPVEGSGVGNTWSKDRVQPMCLVKPSVLGFEPAEGATIGNDWPKDEVKPVMLVTPYMGRFVPVETPQVEVPQD